MGRKAFQRALHFYVINDHPLRKKKKKKKRTKEPISMYKDSMWNSILLKLSFMQFRKT